MRMFDVWVEGYACNGDRGTAMLFGTTEAESLSDAVEILYSGAAGEPYRKAGHPLRTGADGVVRLWGCRFFDNEADARAVFG
jgi:hypothetical protein